MKITILAAISFCLLASRSSLAQPWHPPDNQFVCFERQLPWSPGQPFLQDYYIAVDDPSDAHDYHKAPVFLVRAESGDSICRQFADFFHNHRKQLEKSACHAEFVANPADAFVFVTAPGAPFPPQRPPSLDNPNWLDLGWGTPEEMQVHAMNGLRECNRVLKFVKYYDAKH